MSNSTASCVCRPSGSASLPSGAASTVGRPASSPTWPAACAASSTMPRTLGRCRPERPRRSGSSGGQPSARPRWPSRRTRTLPSQPSASSNCSSSALASGEAHVASPDGDEPTPPEAWGWRAVRVGAGENEREEWRPQGKRVGWLDQDNLYLEPDAAYAAAQSIGDKIGDLLSITPQTLRRRLKERGFLASLDEARETLTIRRTLEQRQRHVLHVHASALYASRKPDKPDNDATSEDRTADPVSGSVSGSDCNPTPDDELSSNDYQPNVGFVGFPGREHGRPGGRSGDVGYDGKPDNRPDNKPDMRHEFRGWHQTPWGQR